MPESARHETRALLRAHLSAASGYRHLTRRCPICLRLQRLAMEHPAGPAEPLTDLMDVTQAVASVADACEPGEDESPAAV